MVVELRRALTFVDKNTALEALRAVWGVLGSALASRDLSTIVVSRGCICVAVDEKGDTIALYRINSEKVAVYNVDEDRIVRELESCVSQGRGHVFRDVGTMAFVGGIEYYVVNLTRFSARVGSGTVSKKRISNQMICHGNVRETVRINRFSEGPQIRRFLPGRQHSCRSGHRPSLFTSKASSEKMKRATTSP